MNISAIDEVFAALTPHQKKIVQALYNCGEDWLTRSKLAKALGKRRLTPYDIDCLTNLSETGLIECSTQETSAPGSDFAYIYHMPDAVAQSLQEWVEKREEANESKRRKAINLID